MSLSGLTAEDIRRNIQNAETRVAAALAEYEAAKRELAWWQQGLGLIDPNAEAVVWSVPGSVVAELFPEGMEFPNGTNPTLRQAIVLVMREEPTESFSVNVLTAALAHRGWLPERAEEKDAKKRVSDMAGIMEDDGQLERPMRGVYKLAPHLAAALEAAGGERKK